MAKAQDTYNPVTGEYVKRISDWIELGGDKFVGSWLLNASGLNGTRLVRPKVQSLTNASSPSKFFSYDSKEITGSSNTTEQTPYFYVDNNLTGWNNTLSSGVGNISSAEIQAYFYGHRMCNSDGTSPYYKSEVPYTPATWAEWVKHANASVDSTGCTLTASGNWDALMRQDGTYKPSVKYGFLYNVISSNLNSIFFIGSASHPFDGALPKIVGNNKHIATSRASFAINQMFLTLSSLNTAGTTIKFKDFRVFELPTGSQIEADFTNLSADELSAKYTFNGLCFKHWKKVTDGAGLTSTLPTASYAGYTPYRMIYQLATPEISYLTPKATIPLYNTNTIVETDTPSDCKADVTVGYKLKSGATAVAGDITAPTPDYMSAVNSVSEDGLAKGVVRGKNISPVNNVSFTLSTDSSKGIGNFANSVIVKNIKIEKGRGYRLSANKLLPSGMAMMFYNGLATAVVHNGLYSEKVSTGNGVEIGSGGTTTVAYGYYMNLEYEYVAITTSNLQGNLSASTSYNFSYTNIQLEEGSSATTFETYKTPVESTLPVLRKIGAVADTYNPETAVLVQRIEEKVFDGTEVWGVGTGNLFMHRPSKPLILSSKLISNAYIDGDTFVLDKVMSTSRGANDSICIQDWRFNGNIPLFKAYLAQQYANGTPVTVYYQLATPVVTTLATTALPTYKPTTVIESDSTVKGNVSADYKLKVGATPVVGDFLASPESVNDIKDLGNSIDVVSSVGRRNLLQTSSIRNAKNVTSSSFTLDTWAVQTMDNNWVKTFLKPNMNYSMNYTVNMIEKTSTYNVDSRLGQFFLYKIGAPTVVMGTLTPQEYQSMENGDTKKVSKIFGTPSNLDGYVVLAYTALVETTAKMRFENVKIEESSSSSLFTPAPEDITYNQITNGVYKTNILLSAPLRSVGDVKDRLFKDSDGKWKIERNIGEKVFNGTENWSLLENAGVFDRFSIGLDYLNNSTFIDDIKSTHYKSGSISLWGFGTDDIGVYANQIGFANGSLRIVSALQSTSAFKSFLALEHSKGTPVTIQYILATPTYETLSQELQTDLDNIPTFPEHNYVYTVAKDNLQPTLHVDYKKLSWLKSRLLVNSLKIYSRNLTDAEMIQNYKVEKERFGM